MLKTQSAATVGLLILCSLLFIRLSLLELPALIDPTETRYATVAQLMVINNDWITPSLPTSSGIEPYLGKPPLHFWLTAAVYKMFGFSEWSSRIPSFICSVLMLLVVFQFATRILSQESSVGALLITLSSGMFFFLAGASVTDVTLAATVTAATYALYSGVSAEKGALPYITAAGFAALGFLTKGPVALVLIAMPFLMSALYDRSLAVFRRLPIWMMLAVFIAITAPWFVLSEIHNPGFLKYFFWNENIARYLFKEYGDRYGSGHVHPMGTSWGMLALAFAPWTVILAIRIRQLGFTLVKSIFQQSSELRFALFWAISAPFFFTFATQLHAMYLLPSVPGLAIICSALLFTPKPNHTGCTQYLSKWGRIAGPLTTLIALGIIVVGAFLDWSNETLLWVVLYGIFGFIVIPLVVGNWPGGQSVPLRFISCAATISVMLYAAVLVGLGPYIETRRSAEPILDSVVNNWQRYNRKRSPTVALLSNRAYSPVWLANAWVEELGQEVKVVPIRFEQLDRKKFEFALLKFRIKESEPAPVFQGYRLIDSAGDWLLYERVKLKDKQKRVQKSHLPNT